MFIIDKVNIKKYIRMFIFLSIFMTLLCLGACVLVILIANDNVLISKILSIVFIIWVTIFCCAYIKHFSNKVVYKIVCVDRTITLYTYTKNKKYNIYNVTVIDEVGKIILKCGKDKYYLYKYFLPHQMLSNKRLFTIEEVNSIFHK